MFHKINPSKAWLIWFVAGLFYLYEFIHRVIISVMIPELSSSFHFSVAMSGILAACYFYAYGLAQIPVGLIIDRFGTRWALSLACLLIALSSFVFAGTENIAVAILSRICIGFGSAFAFVGCLKLGAVWFPARKFSFIVGLTNLLGVSGAIIGGRPIAYAVDRFNWRVVMYISGIIGSIIAILLLLIIRDQLAKHKIDRKFLLKLQALGKRKQIWLVALFAGFMVAPIVAYSELWGVSYLIEKYHLSKTNAAQITTITFIGIALGGPSIGYIASRISNLKLPLLFGAIGACFAFTSILVGKQLPIWTLYCLHILFGFFTSSMLICFALNTQEVATNKRATVVAFTNMVIMLSGAILQSICSFSLSLTPIIACYFLALLTWCYI